MDTRSCSKNQRRPWAAATAQNAAIWEQAAIPKDFKETLERIKVPAKAMRVMLTALGELSVPAAHCDPWVTKKLAIRFVSHMDFAIWRAVHPDYRDSVATSSVARELSSLVQELKTQGMSRYDKLLISDLSQLAESLWAVASCHGRPSQLYIN